MATIAEFLKIDEAKVIPCLNEAVEKVKAGEGEIVLDWTAAKRVEPGALVILEKLAATAKEKNVRVVFRGVNVDIYRVLKLAQLSGRFSFVN